tara:strand:+ start:133 stop:333 length:201 start_codon:yes stop_codon:yes gene_type:complete
MNCINYNNNLYFIKKNINENHNEFIKRSWFIVNKLNEKNNNLNFTEIENLSNIYINEIENGCEYNI